MDKYQLLAREANELATEQRQVASRLMDEKLPEVMQKLGKRIDSWASRTTTFEAGLKEPRDVPLLEAVNDCLSIAQKNKV